MDPKITMWDYCFDFITVYILKKYMANYFHDNLFIILFRNIHNILCFLTQRRYMRASEQT